jgi:hypothetical protein
LIVFQKLYEETDVKNLVVGIFEDLLFEGLVLGLVEDSAGMPAEAA